tara:strand:- start:101 stop:592 length:492 start_codon:yes stop_codon:yes gene_type:complete
MIRAIRDSDCDQIALIEAQTFNTALDRGNLLTFMDMNAFCGFVDEINIPKNLNTKDKVSNLENAYTLVGYLLATIIVDEAEIFSIVVRSEHQKCGRGAGLLTHFLAHLAAENVKSVLLEVAADNVPALSLYNRHGFFEFGRRVSYYKRADGNCDAVMMRRLNN